MPLWFKFGGFCGPIKPGFHSQRSAEKGLLKEWPKDGPPLAYSVKGFGNGFSTVAVADKQLFTMGKIKDENCLIAASTADGKILWTTPIGKGGDPNCTPTVEGGMVYGLSLDGDLACCEAATGKLVWSKSYQKDFGGKMMSGWGYSESPLVDGEYLICTPGGKDALIACLKKKTGEVIWKTAVPGDLGRKGGDGAGYASIVISNAGGVKQYITLAGKGIVSVDAKSGNLLWSYNPVANGTANIPTPIVAGDYVFCSSGYGDGGTALLKIQHKQKGNEWNAEEVYAFPANKMQNHHGGMILLGDHVYMGHGHNEGFPLCLDLKTGQDAWRPGRGAGGGSAAVAYADGNLYFRYQNGTMALIEATPEKYNLRGQFKVKTNHREGWPHPVIAGGMLYLRDQDELHVYNIKAK